jgi:hypothetical protein
MSTVSMKQVHERAKEQQQKWEDAPEMGSMFGQKKKCADRKKADQDKPASRRQKAAFRFRFMIGVIVRRHTISLCNSLIDHRDSSGVRRAATVAMPSAGRACRQYKHT